MQNGLRLGWSALALAAATAAHAAEPSEPAADAAAADTGAADAEITVTARRTTERAQDVPVALSVVSGTGLERTGAFTLADLQQQTPSLTAYNGNPRNSSVAIRGIGVSSASDGLDTSVGVYLDNTYLGRPGMALVDLIDLERVEVLRGPQGTLFGRNSSAGVLNVTTRGPSSDWGLYAEASLGNYGYRQARASVTGPIVPDLLAFRITGFDTHRRGVLDNPSTGIAANSVGRRGVRGQLLLTPGSRLRIRAIADYSLERDTCCVSALKTVLPASIGATTARTLQALRQLGYVPQASTERSVGNSPQLMRTNQWGASLQADWDLGPVTATSITAHRYWHFNPLQDSDGTPLDIIQVNVAQTRHRQFSQELRLASNGDAPLSWQVGGYLYHQRLKDHYILNQFGSDASAFYTTYLRLANPAAAPVNIAAGSQYLDDVDTTVDSLAAFGQANYRLTDRLTLTGGIRYTHDKRAGTSVTSTRGTPYAATSIPFDYDLEVKGNNVSWLASLSWRPSEGLLAYTTASTGYKGAGLNLNSSVTAGTSLVIDPEKVRNYEVGLKQQLFDRRVTLNLAAYWTQLKGLQANIYPLSGAKSYLTNVGNVRARGLEADFNWRADDRLSLTLNGAFNDTRYSSYRNAPCPVGGPAVCDLTGARVYQSPRWTANAIADYHFAQIGDVAPYVIARYAWRSSMFGTVDDGPYGRIPAYGLASFRLGATFGRGKYDLAVWTDNAFNRTYYQNLNASSIVGAATIGYAGQLGTPRTFGATFRVVL